MNQKIKLLEDLAVITESLKSAGKSVVHCHGVFDLLHPGHVLHFKAAKNFGDVLVVTVTPDRYVNKGPGRPAFKEQLRMETLAALEDVDYVALNQWPTAVETISKLKPNVYVKGSDYASPDLDITGKIADEGKAVRSIGGEIRFTDEETFSSSALINRFFSSYLPQTQTYLDQLRTQYGSDTVIERLRDLSGVRVLVIGEAIMDQYCYCIPLAKSPKETIIATKYTSEESFAGGSLAVANHVAGYCRAVTLVTHLGSEDRQVEFLRSKLRRNIEFRAVCSKGRPTIVKRRFVEPTFLTKMFEVQYLDDTPLNEAAEEELASVVSKQLPLHDLVIAADFGHGDITGRVRSMLSTSGKFLAVNTQTNSANLGFNPITKYERVDYACIHEGELRLALHTQFRDLYEIAGALRQKLDAKAFMVTRGPHGSVLFCEDGEVIESPALSMKIVDRVGAGDAFFAITAPCVFKGYEPELVGLIGNCVGALAVETVCNREPVDSAVLFKFITHLLR